MNRKIKTFQDVVGWRMCIGCGACKAVCPQQRIELRDVISDGIRPVPIENICCDECGKCLAVCPGIGMTNDTSNPDEKKELKSGWGTIIELYEGFSTDMDLRFNGSSGGIANALALFCIEKLGMADAVHTSSDEKEPWRNRTTFSTNKKELLAASGSRYSPASPAEGISHILSSTRKSVFIGKPCDIAAHYKATRLIPELAERTGCTIGIFCAGTPSTKGTLDLIDKMKIDKQMIKEFRYRGRGWPGMCAVRCNGETTLIEKMTYIESWSFIQKYRPVRCYQCPDGTSEFADISCGDPWHQKAQTDEPGISIICARTNRGRDILEKAIAAGYVKLEKTPAKSLVAAQKNMLSKRSWIWGRLFTMKLLSIPTPVFKGFNLWLLWLKSSFEDKVRSIYGTLRRAISRMYWKPSVNSY